MPISFPCRFQSRAFAAGAELLPDSRVLCSWAFGSRAQQRMTSQWNRLPSFRKIGTLGFEPRAFRMRSGCDAIAPCAHSHWEHYGQLRKRTSDPVRCMRRSLFLRTEFCKSKLHSSTPSQRYSLKNMEASKISPNWGWNPGPSVYKTDALPLSYRGLASPL